jgi:hypothetical protein
MLGGVHPESSFGNSSFLIIPCMSDENVPPDSQDLGCSPPRALPLGQKQLFYLKVYTGA